MPNLSERITERLIAARWWLLALAVVLAAAAFPIARSVRFDRSIENMFAADDPLLPPYRRLKRTFGGNEIVMAVYVDPDLFSPAGIDRLTQISSACEQVPGVRAVLSLERLMGKEIVNEDNPLAIRMQALFENYTHSSDRRTAAVVCMLDPESTGGPPRQATIAQLRAIMENLPDDLPAGVLAGEPVMVVDGFQYVEQDGRRLGIWSSFLLCWTILLCFRSLRWVLVPLAVVQLTLLLTKATLVFSGIQLSMVSSMMTAIVTVVGIATIVHVIVRFREARVRGLSPPKALLAAGSLFCARRHLLGLRYRRGRFCIAAESSGRACPGLWPDDGRWVPAGDRCHRFAGTWAGAVGAVRCRSPHRVGRTAIRHRARPADPLGSTASVVGWRLPARDSGNRHQWDLAFGGGN